jgi:predicted nucleic acid-binding protein
MSAKTFVDTSTLVRQYDFGQPSKQQAALRRLAEERRTGEPTVSAGILGELYRALTSPYRDKAGVRQPPLLDHDDASDAVHAAARLRVVPVARAVILEALRLKQKHQMQWWDAVHLATAISYGCDRILTEDVPSAAVLEGVSYENPFGALGAG